jgi:hypothetical protein
MRVCTGLLNHFPLPTLVLTGAQGFLITSHFQHLFLRAHRAFESLPTSNTCSYGHIGLSNHFPLPTLVLTGAQGFRITSHFQHLFLQAHRAFESLPTSHTCSYGRTGLSNHFPLPTLAVLSGSQGRLNHFSLPTLAVLTGAQGFRITSHFQYLLFLRHRAFESLPTSNTCCYRRTGLLNHFPLPTLAVLTGAQGF